MSIKRNPRRKNSQGKVTVRMAEDRGPGSIVDPKKPIVSSASVEKSKKQ